MNNETEKYLVERIKQLEEENHDLDAKESIFRELSKFFGKQLDEAGDEKQALEHKLEEADSEVMECKKNVETLLSFIIDTLELDISELGTGFINKSVVENTEIPEIVKKAFEAKEAKRRHEKDGGTRNHD